MFRPKAHKTIHFYLKMTEISLTIIVMLGFVGYFYNPMNPRVTSAAAIPRIFNYQAKLTNNLGVTVADGSLNVSFGLYNAASGGTCLWSSGNTDANGSTIDCGGDTPDGQISVTVTNGVFSVLLGDTTGGTQNTIPAFADSVTTLYLGVTIGADAEMSPRKRIVSTLFAEEAADAELLDSFNSSQVGGTSAFVPVTDSNGNLILTGNPQGADVGQGSIYINPSSAQAGADETLLGVAVSGSSVFRVDREGDVTGAGSGNFTSISTSSLTTSTASVAAAFSAGATTLTGLLTFNGGATADSGVFTVADTSGNVHTSGTLDVDSTSDFGGDITFSAATPSIIITNAETFAITDGTNTLMSLADNGTTGTLTVNTITPTTVNAFTAGGAIDMNTNLITNIGNSGTDFTSSGGLTLAAGLTLSDTTTEITLSSTSPTISIGNTGELSFTDGTNTLMSLFDDGSTGRLFIRDITSPVGQNLVFYPSATNDVQFALGSSNQVQVQNSVPDVDLFRVFTGAGMTTNGVDLISLNFTVASDGGFDANSAIDITIPSPADASDVVRGILVTGTTATTGYETAFQVQNITGGDGDEKALTVGSGWDTDLQFVDTSPVILLANTATLSFTDGTNTLMSLADNGTTGTLTVNTITPTTINAFTAGGAIDMNTNLITNIGNSGTDFTSSGGLTLAGALTANGDISLNDTSADTITIGQNGATVDTVSVAGDVSVTDTQWSITAAGVANFASIGATTASSGVFTTLEATGAVTMNDAGADAILIGAAADTLTLTSNTLSLTDDHWSITAAGAASFNSTLGVTGATTLTGLLTFNGGATADSGVFTVADTSGNVHTSGTLDVDSTSDFGGDITFSAATPSIIITNAETFAITDGTNTLMSLADNGTTGTLTVNTITPTTVNAFTAGGAIDMNTNLITNIGNSGTDFTSSGGLTLAAGLTLSDTTTEITLSSTSPRISFGSTGTLSFFDGAYTLLSLVDNGDYGTLDLQNDGLIENIGNSGTDFSVGGGLTIGGINKLNLFPTISPTPNSNAGLMETGGTIVEADSGTHAILTALNLSAPIITAGTATVTNTATVYIDNAPSAVVTGGNYSIFVDGGAAMFDSDVVVGGSTSRTETLSNAGFTLGGDDLFVAGMVGIEGTIYTDSGLTVGAATTELTFTDTTPTISIGDTGTLSFTDGTNTLMSLADSGTIGTLTTGTLHANFSTANTERLCWDGVTDSDITDCTGSPGDYAEYYGTNDTTVEAGDIVAADFSRPSVEVINEGIKGSKAWVVKSSQPYENAVVGIISTHPNEVIGENFEPEENPRPVALNGRVPVKVTNENGEIKTGDFITTSSTPGFGMKATQNGRVIGMALSDFNDEQGRVIVEVMTGWFDGNSISLPSNTATLANAASLQNLDLANDFFMHGGTISGIGKLLSQNGSWSLDENGTIVAVAIETRKLKTEEMTARLTDDTQMVGEGMIPQGAIMLRINNDLVLKTSKVFVTFRSRTPGAWWVSGTGDGWFEVSLDPPSGDGDLAFDYWIVGVEDTRKPVVNLKPPIAPESASEENNSTSEAEPVTAPADQIIIDEPQEQIDQESELQVSTEDTADAEDLAVISDNVSAESIPITETTTSDISSDSGVPPTSESGS